MFFRGNIAHPPLQLLIDSKGFCRLCELYSATAFWFELYTLGDTFARIKEQMITMPKLPTVVRDVLLAVNKLLCVSSSFLEQHSILRFLNERK
jgi:hypothetical protein